MTSTLLPDIHAYVREQMSTPDYRAFQPDEMLSMPKETQYAYHLLASTRNADLFAHWAQPAIVSGYGPFQAAVAINAFATALHLQTLLAGTRVNPEVLLHVARHPNSTPPIIDKVLTLAAAHHANMYAAIAGVYSAVAGRVNLTATQARVLLTQGRASINQAIANNPNIPETLRVEAALTI